MCAIPIESLYHAYDKDIPVRLQVYAQGKEGPRLVELVKLTDAVMTTQLPVIQPVKSTKEASEGVDALCTWITV